MADLKTYKNGWVKGDLIGRGGQGGTYHCKSIASDSVGALKILNSQNDMERRKRMHREVIALKTTSHPNIGQYIDSNSEYYDNTNYKLYLVSAFISGDTLGVVNLSEKSLEEKINFMETLTAAVSYCHNIGIIHRDIKPDNIVIRNNDFADPVLIDFGLSFNFYHHDDDFKTQDGQHLGNRFMILPEQKIGEVGKRDFRSDVTCLAGIFSYLLFNEQPTMLMDSDSNKPHQRHTPKGILNSYEPHLRNALNNFFDTAFNQQTDQRWQSCEALLNQFKTIKMSTPNELNSSGQLISFIKKQTSNESYLNQKSINDLIRTARKEVAKVPNMIVSILGEDWSNLININAPEKFEGYGKPRLISNYLLDVRIEVYIKIYITGSEIVIHSLVEGNSQVSKKEVFREPILGMKNWNSCSEKLKEEYLKMIAYIIESQDRV